MKIRHIYPDAPFWRAEISRIALHIGGIDFEDVRPSVEEIRKMELKGTFPFGQFPILQVDERTLAQTGAIARFCARLSGLYPLDDDFATAKVDEAIDLATDITVQMEPALHEQDPETRKNLRRDLVENILPRWLGYLETLFLENGNTGFVVGNHLTIADVAVWRLCEWIVSGIIDDVPTNILDPYTCLKAHQENIKQLPEIKEWLSKNQE